MKERPSEIARQILEYGLEADTQKELDIPTEYQFIAQEVYDVPERPEGFKPNFKETEATHTVILASGGLDSTVSWLMELDKTGTPPDAFYVNMGQPYADKELRALAEMRIPVQEVAVPVPQHLDDGKWKHIHPGRNFYYLSLVAEQVEHPSRLVLSALEGETTEQGGDKSRVFFKEANRIFAQLEPPVELVTPLTEMTKTDLVTWALHNGHIETVKKSISCFSPEAGRCGQCQSCLRTWIAFSNVGVDIPFNVHPMEGASQYVEKYQRVMTEAMNNNDYSHYSPKRIAQTLGAFSKYNK